MSNDNKTLILRVLTTLAVIIMCISTVTVSSSLKLHPQEKYNTELQVTGPWIRLTFVLNDYPGSTYAQVKFVFADYKETKIYEHTITPAEGVTTNIEYSIELQLPKGILDKDDYTVHFKGNYYVSQTMWQLTYTKLDVKKL